MKNERDLSGASRYVLGFASVGLKSINAPRPEPSHPELAGGTREALSQLEASISGLRALQIAPLLRQAVQALQRNDEVKASSLALRALEIDERHGDAWYVLGVAREQIGDFASAIQALDVAHTLMPNHKDLPNDLGRLAYRMNLKAEAEQFFLHFVERNPGSTDAINNLVCAIRDQGRYDEAAQMLKAVLQSHPKEARFWNTLGTILVEEGDPNTAMAFFDEAISLDPSMYKADHNASTALLLMGDAERALERADAAARLAEIKSDVAMIGMSRASILASLGQLGESWDQYEVRLDPHYAEAIQIVEDRPMWQPGTDLTGKCLLVFAEQGLGDEIMFANVLPDLEPALGTDGQLILAVEPRLVPLFQRSFPRARVGPHGTLDVGGKTLRGAPFLGEAKEVDLWVQIASLLRQYRRSIDDFPKHGHVLKADLDRVTYWRSALEALPPQPKVGLLWKSLRMQGPRSRVFSAFEQWAPVLRTPGLTFVNLQYGDCQAEIDFAKSEFGVDIWTPPGIDLKQDLDDVAALCCAMDLVLGFSNATFNLAAACGAPAWLLTSTAAWTQLGTQAYPWYPDVRCFTPAIYKDWGSTMNEVAAALAQRYPAHPAR